MPTRACCIILATLASATAGEPLTRREVLARYHESPTLVARAARLCLEGRLGKDEVMALTGDAMRREVQDDRILFYHAPSQVWILTFDEHGEAYTSNINGTITTRRDLDPERKADEDLLSELREPVPAKRYVGYVDLLGRLPSRYDHLVVAATAASRAPLQVDPAAKAAAEEGAARYRALWRTAAKAPAAGEEDMTVLIDGLAAWLATRCRALLRHDAHHPDREDLERAIEELSRTTRRQDRRPARAR